LVLPATWLVAGLFTLTPTARAAYTESFDALRTELSNRAAILTGSVDKVEQKKGQTCLKIIAAIDKSTTLTGDIKTAGKIAKSLIKAFPEEFAMLVMFEPTNLSALLNDTLDNLTAEVQAELDALQTAINALPDGSAKTSA
jgi:hypothetical protein